MDYHLRTIAEEITDEVSHYGDALTDLAAGVSAQEHLTSEDFEGMTAAMDGSRLPGASGVSFVVPAYDHEVAAVQAKWRARGASRLSLYRNGTDTEHAFVVFQRSFDTALPFGGRDLSQTPETAEALRVARRSAAFAVGPAHVQPVDRPGTADRQDITFTLAAPVFGRPGTADARTVHGWITMGMRGDDFLRRTLQAEARDALRVHLVDPAGHRTLTIASVAGGTPMDDPALHREKTIEVGQHTWRLRMTPTTALLSASDQRMAQLTVAVGTGFTLLVALLVGMLTIGRNRAMDRVDQATAALRQDIERRQAVEERLRQRENELRRLAFQDPLTGLANRSLFHERVTRALDTHARSAGTFAVFFIDLDGFKAVNDRYGHSAGDAVLLAVAERLRGCLRDSDTVARFGGDEFAILLEQLAAPEEVHLTATRIVEAVQAPVDLGAREARVTASVGVALNRAGDNADDILREADLAMYTAKSTGKSRHVLAGA
ncbi:diguanylate cyclase [Wangella sp. NEAU-J3]|nr:diguanylate cyclase [Jidongwangia harbinensis]